MPSGAIAAFAVRTGIHARPGAVATRTAGQGRPAEPAPWMPSNARPTLYAATSETAETAAT
jgi:hypothetical protein